MGRRLCNLKAGEHCGHVHGSGATLGNTPDFPRPLFPYLVGLL
jgi:hypothetical protein